MNNQLKEKKMRDKVAAYLIEQDEQIIKTILRTRAKPPIKGRITKGKIRWRGIRLRTKTDGFACYKWLEQRGKPIGSILTVKVKIIEK